MFYTVRKFPNLLNKLDGSTKCATKCDTKCMRKVSSLLRAIECLEMCFIRKFSCTKNLTQAECFIWLTPVFFVSHLKVSSWNWKSTHDKTLIALIWPQMTSHEYKYISYRDFTDNSGYIRWNWWLKSISHKIDVIIIFQISISGLFVDILQVQISNRIIDIYLTHQCDVIWLYTSMTW